jgi:hypothetical protein
MSVQINGSAGVTTNSGAVYDGIQRATAQASTSGSNIDFTNIPSWVKRITVMFNEVSTTGSTVVLVQLGTGGTPTTSGYIATRCEISTAVTNSSYTTGHGVVSGGAANITSGQVIFTNISGNTWIGSGNVKQATNYITLSDSSVTLGGTLNFLRLTCSGDTFDAGSLNILYE